MATTHTTDAQVALASAEAGMAAVRGAYGGGVVRHAKVGSDFATDADHDAERAMMAVIASAFPDDERVGEESGRHPGTGARRWLVDPLCGTENFAATTPLVAVNVALVDGDTTAAAVSGDPIAEELFWTDGRSAFVRRAGDDLPLRPSPVTRLVDVNCDGPSDRAFVGPQVVNDPRFRSQFGPRVLSTTLAVAWVAAGRRAAYVTDGLFRDNVHFAAGIAVCRAAGCAIGDLEGEPLHTGRGLIVAADYATLASLVDIVRPHLKAVLACG